MLRKGSPFDATFVQLDAVNINPFVEIDTKDGYEYHKVCYDLLDNDGSLIAIFSDAHHIEIARATSLRRSDRYLVYELHSMKKKETDD